MPERSSRLVQVAPNERIARREGETDADVRRRWAAQERATSERIRDNEQDSRYYKRRGKARGFSERVGVDLARAMGQQFAKGGSVSKRGDGIAKKGKTKGRFV